MDKVIDLEDRVGERDALASLFEQDIMATWFPIETAPKDGTEILVCCTTGYRCSTRWQETIGGGGYWRTGAADALVKRPIYWMHMPNLPDGLEVYEDPEYEAQFDV